MTEVDWIGAHMWVALLALAAVVSAWALLAYLAAPMLWRHYEHHPSLAAAPRTTATPEGIPGDPLNVGLEGSEAEVTAALLAAGWSRAAPLGWRSDLGIVESVLGDRADTTAPVSTQYLWGRPQDLAFEQEVGTSARQRHHVRLWRSPEPESAAGRPFWIGAATFDQGVGFSHRTGQVTHHIAPDVDAERDGLMAALERARQVVRTYQVSGVGPTLVARNGGGDRYFTDGELTVAVLAVDNRPHTAPPIRLPNPPAVRLKNRIWSWIFRGGGSSSSQRSPSSRSQA
jgi:hypothetical protein